MKHPQFSKTRALLVAATIVVLIALTPIRMAAADIFNNWNTDLVSNGPTKPTVFTIAAPAHVTELATYHWNSAHGIPATPAVTITVKGTGGTFGPFTASPSAGQGGVANVNWTAAVSFDLAPGTYTVVDSQPTTWSQNGKSGGAGFAAVRGTIGTGGTTPTQGPAPAQIRGFEYAVKFVCGRPVLPVVAPGEYFTAINVHNPSPRPVAFRKKIAVALPGEKAGKISPFFEAQLKSDEALEIDCQDILRHAQETGFLKGFVVIETPSELDVVAVYTAGHPAVETLEIEHVNPRVSAAVIPPPSPPSSAYCPGNEHCCCNTRKLDGTYWPSCNTSKGLDCYGNLSGPGLPAGTFAVCLKSAFDPVEIDSSQPPFCAAR